MSATIQTWCYMHQAYDCASCGRTSKRVRTSPERERQVIDHYLGGDSIYGIGRLIGIDHKTVKAILRRNSIPLRVTSRPTPEPVPVEELTEQTAALIEDVEFLLSPWGGHEHPENIAKRLGTTLDSLRRHLQRAGRHELARGLASESIEAA